MVSMRTLAKGVGFSSCEELPQAAKARDNVISVNVANSFLGTE
jgi:hypothetical protein